MPLTFEEAQRLVSIRSRRPLIKQGECWIIEGAAKPAKVYTDGYGGRQIRFVRWLGEKAGKWSLSARNSKDRIYPNICSNQLCVNPEHWGNKEPLPNYRRSRKGRMPRTRVIHDDEIYQIHRMREAGATYSEIAEKFKIGRSTVGSIVNELGTYADFWERWTSR